MTAVLRQSAPICPNPGKSGPAPARLFPSISERAAAGNFSNAVGSRRAGCQVAEARSLARRAAAASSVGSGGAASCAACPAREAAQTVVRAHDRHTVRVPKAGSKLGTVGGHRGAAAARAAGVRRSCWGVAAGARRRTCSLDFVYTSSGRTDRCGWPAQGAWRPWSTRSLSWQRCAARLPHHSKLLHTRRRLRALNTLTETNEMAFGQIRKLLAARRTHAVGGDGLDNGHRGHAVCDRADSRDGCSAGTFARAYRATRPIAPKSVPPIARCLQHFSQPREIQMC